MVSDYFARDTLGIRDLEIYFCCSEADVSSMRALLSLMGEVTGASNDWWLSGNDLFQEDSWSFLSGSPVPTSVFYSLYEGSPRQTSQLSLVGIPRDTVL